MKKLILLSLTILGLLGLPHTGMADSTQVDALIRKLVEKGILTQQEALELKEEIATDEKLLREEGLKTSLPSWVQDMKFKGDLRVRYQHEQRESTNTRDRGRIRLRFGVETNVNDKLKAALGLATGTGDPRATNETLENSFEKSDVRLDYAYAQYTPADWAAVSGGKIPRPFWNPKDLIFDTDITFDGAGANLKKKINDQWEPFFNTGFFILDENSTENYDPLMYGVQPGITFSPNSQTQLKLAGAYYGFETIKNYSQLAHSSSTNTVNSSSLYVYDYDAFSVGSEIMFFNPFGLQSLPHLSLFGEYINNPNADEHDQGFLLGITIGDKKVAGPRQWQLSYNYRRLERNAVLDIFPDSDFYSGRTHVQGHEAILSYSLGKNVSLDLDYYRSAPIGGEEIDSRKATVEHLWQTDMNFKF